MRLTQVCYSMGALSVFRRKRIPGADYERLSDDTCVLISHLRLSDAQQRRHARPFTQRQILLLLELLFQLEDLTSGERRPRLLLLVAGRRRRRGARRRRQRGTRVGAGPAWSRAATAGSRRRRRRAMTTKSVTVSCRQSLSIVDVIVQFATCTHERRRNANKKKPALTRVQ